jgi:hypothetical protein
MIDSLLPSRRQLLIGFLLALATLAFARASLAAMPPLLEQAVKSLDSQDLETWSFTITTLKDGKKTIEHHDASKPEGSRWQLVLKDGAAPTKGDVDDYLKQKAKRDENRKKDDKNEIRKTIDDASVSLVSETAERAVYNFRMKADKPDEKEMAEKIRGTVTVSKAQPFVETMELTSAGEITPIVSVKIKEFYIKMSFRRDADHAVVLPTTMQSRMRGRAMFVKSLDSDVTVAFSDFSFVGKASK